MQFNVPQFLEVEDKIIGPLTLKQFLYVAAGGVVVAFAWYYFKFWLFLLIALPVTVLTLALSFLQIKGRPFAQILLSFFGFLSKPKIYIWKKKS